MEKKLTYKEIIEDIVKMLGITHEKAAHYMMITENTYNHKRDYINNNKFTKKDVNLLISGIKNKVSYTLDKYDELW